MSGNPKSVIFFFIHIFSSYFIETKNLTGIEFIDKHERKELLKDRKGEKIFHMWFSLNVSTGIRMVRVNPTNTRIWIGFSLK